MTEMRKLSDVAAEFGITEKYLMGEHKKGKLPIIKIGNGKFVRPESVIDWVASKEITKPAKRKLSPEHSAKLKAHWAEKRAAKSEKAPKKNA